MGWKILKQFWGFGSRHCLIRGGFDTGFCLFCEVSQATIVKPDFGELALTNGGGLLSPVLTLQR